MTAFKIWRPARGPAGCAAGRPAEEVEERHSCDVCMSVIGQDEPYLMFSARMVQVVPHQAATSGLVGFDLCDRCRRTKALAQVFSALTQPATLPAAC